MQLFSKKDLETLRNLKLKHPGIWLATWFGTGFFKPAPGTWGSLASIPPALILFSFQGIEAIIIGILIIFAIGLWATRVFEKQTGAHDHKMIVIDEAAGQWIALLVPLHFSGVTLLGISLAFVLFRFFDIMKPWPIGLIDKKLKGPAGVMLDDIFAGLFAGIILTAIYLLCRT